MYDLDFEKLMMFFKTVPNSGTTINNKNTDLKVMDYALNKVSVRDADIIKIVTAGAAATPKNP